MELLNLFINKSFIRKAVTAHKIPQNEIFRIKAFILPEGINVTLLK